MEVSARTVLIKSAKAFGPDMFSIPSAGGVIDVFASCCRIGCVKQCDLPVGVLAIGADRVVAAIGIGGEMGVSLGHECCQCTIECIGRKGGQLLVAVGTVVIRIGTGAVQGSAELVPHPRVGGDRIGGCGRNGAETQQKCQNQAKGCESIDVDSHENLRDGDRLIRMSSFSSVYHKSANL